VLAIICLLLTSAIALPPRAPAAVEARPFDADRAYRDLIRQCEFGPRVPGTEAHAQCAAWLAKQLGACADEVVQHRFLVPLGGKVVQLTNIVATFHPKGNRHLLLCAHWDSRPTADRDPDPAKRTTPIPGANDGASGVALLLEIARALKSHPSRQQITIALFDGEDYGSGPEEMFLGSRMFAERYSGPPPAWAVLLDMVGDRDLRIAPEQFSLHKAPQVVDRIWRAAQRAGCAAFVRERGPAVLDDHVFLLQQGIPCIALIDFDYPYWHTSADTPDKCSPGSLQQVGQALLRAIAEDEAEH